jgi:O-antigen ligase
MISVLKGSSHLRLQGVLNGIYSNPNDLAFAIVLSLPLVLLLLLSSRNAISKFAWSAATLLMLYTIFLTASRAGFIDLVISAPVALWFFGVKGRRPQLIVITIVAGALLMAVGGKHLVERFSAISGNINSGLEQSAHGSYEERKFLMARALTGIAHYPLTGVGAGDFLAYSGKWKQVHMTYLQIGVEGGIPVLILYFMFFFSGFRNLRELNKRRDLDPETRLFAGALYTCLVGFVVGACFAPEAYQFFPYFTIAYISALLAIVKERAAGPPAPASKSNNGLRKVYSHYGKTDAVTLVR